MIIAKLMGGLGNQMFQYAAGRNLSVKLNSTLKLDHSFLEGDPKGSYTKRHYELDVFNCIQNRLTQDETRNIQGTQEKSIFSSLTSLFTKKRITVFNENGPRYNEDFENLSGTVYLNGYWQSEKYFLNIRDLLLKEFSLKIPLSKEAENIKNDIQANANAVSVHFRRGDYVNLTSANTFHGTTELDYYAKAIETIKMKVTGAAFFIFSDDIDWVKENFKLADATYVRGLKSYEDLDLMKTCGHNITANSSFSWWGAWLNENKDKTVIAPKQWFGDTSINTDDLIPKNWFRI